MFCFWKLGILGNALVHGYLTSSIWHNFRGFFFLMCDVNWLWWQHTICHVECEKVCSSGWRNLWFDNQTNCPHLLTTSNMQKSFYLFWTTYLILFASNEYLRYSLLFDTAHSDSYLCRCQGLLWKTDLFSSDWFLLLPSNTWFQKCAKLWMTTVSHHCD